MKRIFLAIVFFVPMSVSAEYLDVIEFEMLEGCSFDKYLEIVSDFNDWGDDYGYSAKDAATFGKAWDAWRDALGDPKSSPAQLWARFQECTQNLGRWGYDVY
jgi:hypothetical protein